MKLIHLGKDSAKIKVTSEQDLWYLLQVIEPLNIISGKTFRKVSIGENRVVQKQKAMFLRVKVEKVELESAQVLRVSGKIVEGPQDVSMGSYHTFNIEVQSEFTLQKEKWLTYEIEYLKEAEQSKGYKMLLCLFDRDEALFAVSSNEKVNVITKLTGDPKKKDDRAAAKGKFYEEIVRMLQEMVGIHKPNTIIVASPAFYREEVVKRAPKEMQKKIVVATCSSAKESAILEVLSRPETQSAIKDLRFAREVKLVDEALERIAKGGAVEYGQMHVEQAAKAGAIDKLLVSNSLIRKFKQQGKFNEIYDIMALTEKMRGKVCLISGDAGAKLKSLGGIAALLRFKV